MSYTVIQDWMCTELKLKGNELLIYALVHGYSQDGESRFSGSRKYIAKTFNISLPTVDKAIKNLLENKLIERHKTEKNGVVYYEYNSLHPVKKLYTPYKETLPNNNINNKNNNSISKDIEYNSKTGDSFLGSVKKPKKKNLYASCIDIINSKTKDQEVRDKLVIFLDNLLERNKLYGKNQFKGTINKLFILGGGDIKKLHTVLDYTIEHGYLTFYDVIQKSKNVPKKIEHSNIDHVPTMTKEDYKKLQEDVERRKKNGQRISF